MKHKKIKKPYKFNRINFWMNPDASGAPEKRLRTCRPTYFLNLINISTLVVSTLKRYAKKRDAILEIGCGTGRNLVALQKAGFKKLCGIELSPKTVAIGWKNFPEYKDIQVIIGPAEKVIDDVGYFDVIYTSGLLMHIPPEHEWLFERISQKARKMIMTNEGESLRATSEHAWNRDYQIIFEKLGWKQIEMETGDHYPPLPATTIKRVFIPAVVMPMIKEGEVEDMALPLPDIDLYSMAEL